MPKSNTKTSSAAPQAFEYPRAPLSRNIQYNFCWSCKYHPAGSCHICDGTRLVRAKQKFLKPAPHPYGAPCERPLTAPSIELNNIIARYDLNQQNVAISEADTSALQHLATTSDLSPPPGTEVPDTSISCATEKAPAITLTAAQDSYQTIEYDTWFVCRETTKASSHLRICFAAPRNRKPHKGSTEDCDRCLGASFANHLFSLAHAGDNEAAKEYRFKLHRWQQWMCEEKELRRRERAESTQSKDARLRADSIQSGEARLTAENVERASKEHEVMDIRRRRERRGGVALEVRDEIRSLEGEVVEEAVNCGDEKDVVTETGSVRYGNGDVWCDVAGEVDTAGLRERFGWPGV